MGGVQSSCCPRRTDRVDPGGEDDQQSLSQLVALPEERRRPSGSADGGPIDPQTFEFVDALHLTRGGAARLEAPRRTSGKRNSLTAWLAGGLFATRSARSEGASLTLRERGAAPLRPVKMLMSGAGESGKSTVVKQMKIIHQGGFTVEELYDFRPQIYRNIQDSMLQILDTMEAAELSRDARTLEAVWVVKRFRAAYEELDGLPELYVEAINHLWVEVIRHNFDWIARKSCILDSAPYFFDELNRIARPGFIPTNEDVLRARITTTGINEYTFRSGQLTICMIDVGGQRSERRKWIEAFDNVTTLIFCVAISEYDQMLREEPRQNRLLESFQLWESVINSKWFQRSSVVLFLNKKDIFREKLQSNPLARYFPEYKPPPEGSPEEVCYEAAADFLKNKFLAMNYGRVQVYPYLTCATDTKNIDMVFAAVKETVLANNLRSAGIL